MDWELIRQHLFCGSIPMMIFLLVYQGILFAKTKKQGMGHIILTFVLCFYFIGILIMTGIWFRAAFSPRIVYIPFVDMIRGPLYAILNVFLFVPLGLFLPLLYKDFNRIWRIAAVGFLISLSVEIAQMFGTGTTDINDLITNTVGACVGYVLFNAMRNIIPEKWMKDIQLGSRRSYFELALFWGIAFLIMLTIQPIFYQKVFRS